MIHEEDLPEVDAPPAIPQKLAFTPFLHSPGGATPPPPGCAPLYRLHETLIACWPLIVLLFVQQQSSAVHTAGHCFVCSGLCCVRPSGLRRRSMFTSAFYVHMHMNTFTCTCRGTYRCTRARALCVHPARCPPCALHSFRCTPHVVAPFHLASCVSLALHTTYTFQAACLARCAPRALCI